MTAKRSRDLRRSHRSSILMAVLTRFWPGKLTSELKSNRHGWRKARTIEQFNSLGHRTIVCAGSKASVTGPMVKRYQDYKRTPYIKPRWIRYTVCKECKLQVEVVGPTVRPRLIVHNGGRRMDISYPDSAEFIPYETP
jgi:hypothetical protein